MTRKQGVFERYKSDGVNDGEYQVKRQDSIE